MKIGMLDHQPLVDVINAGMEKTSNRLNPPPSRDAIGEAFAATRESVAREQERTEAVCAEWSVAQHARRAS